LIAFLVDDADFLGADPFVDTNESVGDKLFLLALKGLSPKYLDVRSTQGLQVS
jgi:hypothetical protein